MQKYTAIILASREANEVNRIYFLYTFEQGLVKAVGKGVRKSSAKLAGHLEPGTLSEVYIARAKGMGQITGAITLDSFENIKKDFEKLGEFLKIASFFLKNFAEGEKDEKIFELLSGFLKIADDADNADLVAEAFWWKLFYFLGSQPEAIKCVNCGKRLRPASKKCFSVKKGGAACSDCASIVGDKISINDNQIKLLRVFWGNPLRKIVKVKIEKKDLDDLARIRESFKRYNF